jgi:hypothetical protein
VKLVEGFYRNSLSSVSEFFAPDRKIYVAENENMCYNREVMPSEAALSNRSLLWLQNPVQQADTVSDRNAARKEECTHAIQICRKC